MTAAKLADLLWQSCRMVFAGVGGRSITAVFWSLICPRSLKHCEWRVIVVEFVCRPHAQWMSSSQSLRALVVDK
jgi:hypothetical protein